jgi:uncharacterized protein involved in exopolysaccharide biosynthesis
MDQTKQVFDITNVRDFLTIIFKHKKKVFFTVCIIFVASILFALQLKSVYESQSLLLIRFGREFIQRPDTGGGGGFSVPETIIRSEMSILSSRELREKVINTIGVYNLYPGLAGSSNDEIMIPQTATRLFERNLGIASLPGSSLIRISFSHPDPFLAAKVVNAMVDIFKDKHLQVFGANSTEFLEAQQKVFQEKLRDSEQKLANFKERNRVFSYEEQKGALVRQATELDTQVKTAQGQLNELEQKTSYVQSAKWVVDTPQDLRTQITTLEQREREALQKYNETSAIVRNIRQEIQAVRNSMKSHTEELRQIELAKNEGERIILKTRLGILRRQFADTEAEIRAFDKRGQELQNLRRDTAEQEQNYQTYARKLEESLIMDDMDRKKMVAISVVEKALPALTPRKMKFGKKQIIAIGFILGIGAGIGLSLLLEFMSPGLTTPLSAERRLGLPVMVAIARKD